MIWPINLHQYQVIAASLITLVVNCFVTDHLYAGESSEGFFTAFESVHATLLKGFGSQNLLDESPEERDLRVESEVHCLALNIYFEARSEPELGQLAVGHVVMNRVANKHYPNRVCDVVRQGGEERLNHCQFSWWCDGRSDKPLNRSAWRSSLEMAEHIYAGYSTDPTNGALWYHADYASPYWKAGLSVAVKIGQHVFYTKKKQPKVALN
jgi:hypothetical protein